MSSERSTNMLGRAVTTVAVAASALAVYALRQVHAKRAAAAAAADAASDDIAPLPYGVLLFDIEGTTTPISFVKDVLFPYVRERLGEFLMLTYDSRQTRADLQALIELAEADAAAGVEGVPMVLRFPTDDLTAEDLSAEFRAAQIASAVANVNWQMSSDRKSTALKALQGHLWKKGYKHGQLKGQLFGGADGDVATQLRDWTAQGYDLAVYSSGSVGAQKLLFQYSDAGDLSPLFSANFDTTSGMKQDAASYANIARKLGREHRPDSILFLTDIWAEAWAAHQAGLHAVLLGQYRHRAQQHSRCVRTFNVCARNSG